METNSAVNKQNSMAAQVASSKGTEWMVSSYNAWQQRSPLPSLHETAFMRLASKMAQNEKQLNSVIALSFRSVLLIIGIILSVKSR